MKANLLRVVKSALGRSRPASDHPDANLLAAFAENTLLARERADVAGHLADCAECREFLALAFGAAGTEPAVKPHRRPVRRWSPVWNWAASMAAVCIVVSAVWEFRAQRVPPIEPPPAPSAIPAPAATPPPLETPKKMPAPPVVAAKGDRGRSVSPLAVPQQPAPPPPPPPPPAKQETADALSTAPRQPPQAFPGGQQVAVQAPAPQNFVQEEKELAPAARARSISGAAGAAMKPGRGAVSGFVAHARPASALWTIAFGAVEHSADGGATWKPVAIDGQVTFRAVASSGSDVWAGGSAGALFHSADVGAHWERVALGAAGTIVEIRAHADGDILVITDAPERWHTLDNGRTWVTMEDTPH